MKFVGNMTQEEKKLLLVDLCSRLPYGVILNCCNTAGKRLTSIDENGLINHYYDIDEVKPYLFPKSSMTVEQRDSYRFLAASAHASAIGLINFYNKNHIDYRGLIPKGLANDATNLNIY